MSIRRSVSAAALLIAIGATPVFADMDAAKKWVDSEFQPSTLSKEDQLKEMEWFIKAAEPFKGMEINVLSEDIPTHHYEAEVLTKAFEEITGIKVNHQILGEGEVVQAVQTQMQTNRNLYDGYINDSDLIGTHSRLQSAVNLTDWMAGEGKDVTNPTLDIDDFMGKSFTTGPDGKLWQLPDQQFANLYWFRKDWFDRPDLKEKFKAKYGYELGVPVNWSAYEDIADFFTNDVKEIDGVKVYGHMDYGKRAPDLGWRMTDAWLSMAGEADVGMPNGRPVDEWGIRMEKGSCNPVGASVSRGGGDQQPGGRLRGRPSGTNGCANTHLPVLPTSTSISRCRPSRRATSPSRSSGTRPSPPRMVAPKDKGNNTVDDQGNAALADGTVAARPLLEGRLAARLSGRRFLDAVQLDPGRSPQGGLALRPVRRLQDGRRQEEPCRSDLHPRQHGPRQVLHRTRAQARRPDRVLPLARPRRLDADRHQRARLSEARPALLGEYRRRQFRRLHAAAGDGPPRRRRWTRSWPACRRWTRRTTSITAVDRG